jgi:hypothetical protein
MRARRGGVPLRCAEDVVVHHFGESSFGELVASGERDAVLAANRRRFEDKWGEPWRPYGRGADAGYDAAVAALRSAVEDRVPAAATVSSSAAATTGCSSSEPRGLALPAG